ncbi:PrsW family intramembrane metalloprotease [Candidatus Peregrinibacteria bacterium]|nr:PrsW family intramembrane metalloprotease [Candidatus Peregrinibacteria bacterium]
MEVVQFSNALPLPFSLKIVYNEEILVSLCFGAMLIISLFLGLITALPILIWACIFFQFRPERKDMLFFTFLAGCFSPLIVLLYQKLWGQTINLIFFELEPINFQESIGAFANNHFLQSFLVFVFGVGMIEEFVKHFVIRKEKPIGLVLVFLGLMIFSIFYAAYLLITGDFSSVSWNVFNDFSHPLVRELLYIFGLWMTFFIFIQVHKRLVYQSIDQVILVSIMSALGFSFVENIIYLLHFVENGGTSLANIATFIAMRSIFVVMVHMFCSGVFGYYYGISLFAGPYLQENELKGKKFFLLSFIWKILRFSKKTVYQEEKLFTGLFLSMVFHGIYDFLIEINLNLSDVLGTIGIHTVFDFPLRPLILMSYLLGGFWFLVLLLHEKENHIKFGLVGTKEMPERDYQLLLKKIRSIQNTEEIEEKLIKEGWINQDELKDLRKKIQYLKKFELLEEKYLAKNWTTAEGLKDLRMDVEILKSERKRRSGGNQNILSSPV